jgi:DNA-binding response OmpR family regulator
MTVVLVADDDQQLREIHELWLDQQDDWSVRTAPDGEEALAQMDERIDIVLLDRRMPRLSGDEAARTICSTYPDCVIVMVSAFEPDSNVADVDYDRYITKPTDRTSLLDAVRTELNQSQAA